MVLSLEPADLSTELQYARKARNERLAALDNIVASYHSPFYKNTSLIGRDSPIAYNPENHAYQYVTLVVPHLVYNDPRVRVQARAYGPGELIAIAHRHILNNWVQATNLKETLTHCAHDAMFNAGIVITTIAPDFQNPKDGGEPAMNPVCDRISPRLFLIDPYATTRKEARYMGHEWVTDKEDLLARAEGGEEEGWRIAAIKSIPDDYGVEGLSTRPKDGPSRKELLCIDLWIRDAISDDRSPTEGFNGTSVTLALSNEAEAVIIRDPRAAFVPPRGPYSVCDFSYVPDRAMGLAPLPAVEGQVRELNKLTRRAIDMSMAYRRPILIDDNDENLAEKLKKSTTDMIIAVTGLDKNKVVDAEIGGITAQMIRQLEMAQERLSRNSSFYEIQRGGANSGSTATEVAMANASTDVRINHMKARFDQFATEILENVSWYYFYEPESRATLKREVMEEIGMPMEGAPIGLTFEYQGGDAEKMENVNWYDLSIEIEPMSMGYMSGNLAQKRAMDLIAVVAQLAQLQAAVPGADLSDLASLAGDAFNVPNLGKIAGIQKIKGGAASTVGSGPPSQGSPSSGASPLPGQETGADLASIARQ